MIGCLSSCNNNNNNELCKELKNDNEIRKNDTKFVEKDIKVSNNDIISIINDVSPCIINNNNVYTLLKIIMNYEN